MDQPVKIKSFNITGNHRTNLSFFEREFQHASRSSGIIQLHHSLQETTARLQSLGIFSYVDTQLKLCDREKASDPLEAEVVIDIKEKNVPFLKAESYFGSGGNSVGANLQFALRNPTGCGETARVTCGGNNNGSRDLQMSLLAPSVSSRRFSVEALCRLYEDNSNILYSSFRKNVGSVSLALTSLDKKHKLDVSATLRDELGASYPSASASASATANSIFGASVLPTSSQEAITGPSGSCGPLDSFDDYRKNTSMAVMHSLAPSSKIALEYVGTPLDTRDHPSNPSRGSLVQGAVELAMPPGTAQFLKTNLTLESHIPLTRNPPNSPDKGIVASLCGSFGTLRLLDFTNNSGTAAYDIRSLEYSSSNGGQRRLVHMSDRFFVGGPMGLRGIHHSGSGPRSAADGVSGVATGDALGGLTKMSALAALSAPVPFTFSSSENMRTFCFFNCGLLLPHSVWPLVPLSVSLPSAPDGGQSSLFSYLRTSVGCGVSYVIGPVRLEMTYSLPLRAARHDVLKPFQLGLGLSMNSN